MSAAVDLASVTKAYGDFLALDSLNLSVAPGEVLGLLGHNGAGKTTSMKLILGLTTPSAGQVRLFGENPAGHAARALRYAVGYLPESVSFYEQLTGREVLDYFRRLKRVARTECDRLLDQVGLTEAAQRRVKTYSKGMRQRLGLAQALLGQPKLLLLDEPTVGLDPLGTRDFFVMLDELRQQGTTVILCSHVLAGIESHIDKAAILGHGRLLAHGSLDELRRQAGLPLTIRVRGHWPPGTWENRLTEMGIHGARVNGRHVEFTTSVARKIELTRFVLAEPGVEDIEWSAPSLESLYAHFGSGQDTGRSPCTPS